MPDRLLHLVKSGRIADEAALKSAFRSLAKRIHPDLACGGVGEDGTVPGRRSASDSFMVLRADYEEALAWLSGLRGPQPVAPRGKDDAGSRSRVPRPPEALPWSIRDFYEGFQDLLARGFPRLAGKPWPAGPLSRYEASREGAMRLLAGRDRLDPGLHALAAFLDFEDGYLALASADPAGLSKEVRLSQALRNLMLDIAGYHAMGFSQSLRYARNEGPRLEKELRERGEPRPLAFLALLMDDLAKGPACLDE
jgi:hypothetical protein